MISIDFQTDFSHTPLNSPLMIIGGSSFAAIDGNFFKN